MLYRTHTPISAFIIFLSVVFVLLHTCLLASLDSVVDGVVTSLPNLWLEVQVDQLSLLGCPLAIGVSVVN